MHSFENRRVSISEFSSCVTSVDGCGRAVLHLQNDSYGDFQRSKQCKICLNFRMFTRENKPLFWQKWTTDVFSYFRPPCWCPCTWAPTWRPILISINLCETLCQITRVWNTAQTWGLDRVLIYIFSIACKFLDFIHWMVFDFYFDGVTVKTGNS